MVVTRVAVAWILFGLVAALLAFGLPLLRIIALGPISLIQAFAG